MRKIYFITINKKTLLVPLFIILGAILSICGISMVLYPQKNSISSEDTISTQSNLKRGKLAVIIDDFGSSRDGVSEMMSIKRPLTFAVMPFMEYTQTDAESGHEKGFEIIVHMPMEPNQGKKSWLGPNAIMADMESQEVYNKVLEAFENVPYAKGLNNHMGSKATGMEQIMSPVLDVIKEKNLYFVDSLTTTTPVSKKLAQEKNVIHFQRNIFLDGQKPKSHVIKQLQKAGDIALEKGFAIAIGHVGIEGGKVTAQAIQEMIPHFDKSNIELVFVSDLLNN